MANILILFGGNSIEYSISLQSAHALLTALPKDDDNHYYPIGITHSGKWVYFNGDYDLILKDTWHKDIAHCQCVTIPANNSSQLWIIKDEYLINILHVDAAFIMMHGTNGEDGSIASLLQLANITNLTCPALSGALAFDKYRSHLIAQALAINVAKNILIHSMDDVNQHNIETEIGYPCVIKPNRCGSSYGISLVNNKDELSNAIELAFNYDNEILIEEYIKAKEVGVAIITNKTTYVSSVDELNVDGVFDTTKKYISHEVDVKLHALEKDIETKIKDTALKLYHAHGCDKFARVDLFLTEDNKLFFNEINTIPGFTQTSRFPIMCNSDGINFKQLVSLLCEI